MRSFHYAAFRNPAEVVPTEGKELRQKFYALFSEDPLLETSVVFMKGRSMKGTDAH